MNNQILETPDRVSEINPRGRIPVTIIRGLLGAEKPRALLCFSSVYSCRIEGRKKR
jgi:hypothetical protein